MRHGLLILLLSLLVAVLALCYYVTRRLTRLPALSRYAGGIPREGRLEVLSRVPLGKDQSLVVTAVGKRCFLLGCAAGSISLLTELTEGQTKQQVTNLLGVSDSEALRQWTQSLWRQLYCDEKDSALWLGTAAFLNEAMTFHKEPLEVLAEDYYASSYCLPMGTGTADKIIAGWLNQQTNDLLTDDTGAIETEKRDLLRLYNTIYYKSSWRDAFESSRTYRFYT